MQPFNRGAMIDGRSRSFIAVHKYELFICFTAAVCLVLGMDLRLGVYDEGVILTGAMRVAAGDIPHLDFYANYGPAQFYLIGALFKLFGQYAIVERAYDVVVRAAIVAVGYGMIATVARKSIALAGAVICGLWLFSIPFYGYTILPVILLSLVSAVLVLPAPAGQFSAWRLVAAGATVGLAALFRYDVGFFVFVSLGAVLAFSGALRSGRLGQAPAEVKRDLLWYVIGTSIVFVPVAVCYLAVASIAPFIHDIFSYPVHYYAQMRSLPFPGLVQVYGSLDKLAVYLPILIFCATACSLFLSRADIRRRSGTDSGRDNSEQARDWLLITLALLTAMLYLKGLVRVSVVHMLASLTFSVVLLAVLLDRASHQGRFIRAAVWGLCGLSVISVLDAASTTARMLARERWTVIGQVRDGDALPGANGRSLCGRPYGLPRIKCLLLDESRAEAARFVISSTSEDERIFVGLTRHDKIFANDNLFYFVTGRLPGTRWHQFDPGLQTRVDIQREIIAELRARNVRVVVLESNWDGVAEPNDSAKSSGVHLLDEYIRQSYIPIRTYGNVTVLFRASR